MAGDSYYDAGAEPGTAGGAGGDIQSTVPGFDAARLTFSQTGDMDLGLRNAEMNLTTLSLQGFLSKPVIPADGVFVVPHFAYELSEFDFSGSAAPFQDEDLHSLALSVFALSMRDDTPWMWGLWGRAELATDFQDVDSDDFTFDLAAGVGYRFNPSFTLGVGGVVTNLNGDEEVYPGINFDWVVNERVRCGFYGPTGVVAYTVDDNWLLSARFDLAGGTWNITDNNSRSRNFELDDNRLGIYASRRLSGNFWATAGVGFTINNDLEYTNADGRTLVGTDPDSTVFYALSLRMKAW